MLIRGAPPPPPPPPLTGPATCGEPVEKQMTCKVVQVRHGTCGGNGSSSTTNDLTGPKSNLRDVAVGEQLISRPMVFFLFLPLMGHYRPD